MLHATHRSRTHLGGRVVSLLVTTAALVWILPTLRGGDSLSGRSEMAVAAAGGTAAENANADAPAPGGAAAIRGAWRAVRIEQPGEETTAGAVPQLTLVFDEKRFVMRVGQQLIAEAPYSVAASQNPSTIKLTYAGQATHGIWERKGDTLTLCLADVDQARPKKFVVGPDGGKLLLVLQIPADPGEIIPLLVIDADGKNLRTLVSLPEYTAIGSSAWSPDGKRIAFDAWRTVFGEGFSHIHEFVANADGTDVLDLGEGRIPSWSPDGKRIALTYYHGQPGVWIVHADGTGTQLVDRAGFGSSWRPTANCIAYAAHGSSGANLYVLDLDIAEDARPLLTRAYRQIFWGMAWSPDGKWIAFKADTADGKSELAAVHVDGEASGFKVLLPTAMPESGNRFSSHIAWGGDGKRVLVGLCHPDRQSGHKLYFLDFAQKDPPQLVPGAYPDGYITGVSMSRDGKKILFGISPSGDPTRPRSATMPPTPATHFKNLDRDGDGVLSLDEYLTERRGIEGTRKGRSVFAVLDADHDGKVSLSEFLNPPGQAHFRELDDSGDGYLDLEEFTRGMMPSASRAHAERSASDPYARRTYAAFDKNHDEKLDFAEFADRSGEGWFLLLDRNEDGGVSPVELAQGYPDLVQNKHLKAVFALLDKNRDGKLTLAEFIPGVASAEVLFYRQDKDGDGKLALEEYKSWIQTPEGRSALKTEFEAKDKNRDGKLTLAEYLGSK
jgi:uncharacterized protein (TIGR03067 family)